MADKKVSQLTALTGANTASGDLLYIVDISEPVAADQSKKITLTEFQSAPISAGTANGVAFLNASKVLTTGSALTFDGTNLGVGTSSPGAKLDVNGGTNSEMRLTTSGSGYLQVGQFTNGAFIGTSSTDPTAGILRFGTGGSVFATIDTSGNLGLGVTPSAWGSGFKALQIGGYGALWNVADAYISSSNIYSDGARKYLNTGFATEYLQYSLDGSHRFYTAPSGTIDTAVTITERFKITPTEAVFNDPGDDYDFRVESDTNTHAFFVQGSDGYVGIGTSAPDGIIHARVASGNAVIRSTSGGGGGASLVLETTGIGSQQITANVGSVQNLTMYVAGSERLRIDSSGASIFKPAAGTGAVFNEDGVDADFRVESDTNTHALFVEGTNSNVKVGGSAERATTVGTNHLDIFNGTAPVGTLTNGISIYSSAGEAYVMDAAGNATLFSPHDAETNEWIFRSKHTPTGKVLKIDVERLLKFVNDHFGLDAVHEFIED